MSHAELVYNTGEYHSLNEDLREWLESNQEKDVVYTKHIKLVEDQGIQTPRLEFKDTEGNSKETIFADHVPVSMLVSLIKDKEFVGSKADL